MPVFIKHTYIFFSHTSTVTTENLCHSYTECVCTAPGCSPSPCQRFSATRGSETRWGANSCAHPRSLLTQPGQFQPAASQITPAARFPSKRPSPSHQPVNNRILFGLADRALTLAGAAGPNGAASGRTDPRVLREGTQAPAHTGTGAAWEHTGQRGVSHRPVEPTEASDSFGEGCR